MTLRQTIIRRISRNMTIAGIMLSALSIGVMTQTEAVDSRPVAKGSLTDVMNNNVCKDANGALPTGAVVRITNGGYKFTTNERIIGIALEEALGGKQSERITPIYFCK